MDHEGTKTRRGLRVTSALPAEIERIAGEVIDAAFFAYLKLTGHRLDFPINLNVSVIKNGIKRLVM